MGGVAFTGAFNYPFLYRESYYAPDPAHPITPNNSIGLLENGLVNVALGPLGAAISEPTLVGIQYHPPTMSTQDVNFTLQYQLTPNQSFQIAYVGTFPRHEELFPNDNNVSVIAPPTLPITQFIPYPDVSPGSTFTTFNGSGFYNSLQTVYERRFSGGLHLLANFTYSACRTDGIDVDNNDANIEGYRAPDVPGFGIKGDYQFCDIDVRKIVHVSGGYELPFGAGKKFLNSMGRPANALIGGWKTNFILSLQDGQPFSIPCDIATGVGVGCQVLLVPGQNPIGGLHNVNQWTNPAAFSNPPVATTISQTDFAPLGGAPTQVVGPGFHRLDFSLFKEVQTSERTHVEFRAEFFNITNHPNFSIPVPGTSATDFRAPDFGQITYTRDSPNDPRQIQFALKFYW
jgi:hypothetical protein